jgi:hypothetical protein
MRRDAEQAAPGDHREHLGQQQPRISQREAAVFVAVFEAVVVALIMLGVVLPILWAISK